MCVRSKFIEPKGALGSTKHSRKLANLLGYTYPTEGYYRVLAEKRPEIIHTLEMLDGPHGPTMFKVLQLRQKRKVKA